MEKYPWQQQATDLVFPFFAVFSLDVTNVHKTHQKVLWEKSGAIVSKMSLKSPLKCSSRALDFF